MANVTFSSTGSTGFLMNSAWLSNLITLLATVSPVRSNGDTTLTYTDGLRTLVANGSFSNFDAFGDPQAGTVTSFQFTDFFFLVIPATMSASGLSLAVPALNGWVAANDGAALTSALFDGADTMTGSAANETVFGYAGDDILNGGAGNDTLTGGLGNDTYVVDVASDSIVEAAGQGTDTVQTTLASFSLGATAGSANVENLTYVGGGNFVGVGGALAGTLTGGAGNDTLIGSQAGGALDGGAGNDVLWFYGATALQGGAGFDHAIQLDVSGQTRSVGAAGIEVYLGNAGNDAIDAVGANASTIIYGGAGTDTLTLGAAGGFLFGQDGNDTLNGGSGNDTLIGNAGADTFSGGGGNDVIYIDLADVQFRPTESSFDGGAGIDYVIVEGTAGVNVDLRSSNVEVFVGNAGQDAIQAQFATFAMGLYGGGGDDFITGPSASSQLFGMDGNDYLGGNFGNDVMLGGNGNDTLEANPGDDLLIGEGGDDLLIGGMGSDTLWGDVNGVGSDTFRFFFSEGADRDQILDFGDVAGNQDVIQFILVSPSQVTVANDGAGNVLITFPAIGGTHSILVYGMTAAAIQDDLVFG